MPAEGANVTVALGSSEGLVAGQYVFVQTAGTMQVVSKPNSISVILKNVEDTAAGEYTDNAAPTTAIPAGSLLSPTGSQGASGALSGAAGGDLEGNYPNPTLGIAKVKGTIIVGNGTTAEELAVGSDGQILHARSSQALGQQWSGVDLAGTLTTLLNTLPIAKGGTGAGSQQAALNALAALTTRGDMLRRDSSGNVTRLGLGTAGTVLLTLAGLDPGWSKITAANIDDTFAIGQRQTCFVAGQTINLNGAAGSDTLLTFVSPTPSRYIIRRITLESASLDLSASAARIGIYTNTAKGGTPVVVDPNNELTNITSSALWEDLVLSAVALNTVMTSSTLYLHLSAAHGSAATVKLWIFGDNVS